jgi:hypothetical protein
MIRFIHYLKQVIQLRLKANHEKNFAVEIAQPFIIESADSDLLSIFIKNCKLDFEETIVLLISLVPHLQPDFFDNILQEYLPPSGDFPEFGGVRGNNHRGILPTGETALFILAGNDLEKRLTLYDLFSFEHFFAKQRILYLEEVKLGEPRLSGRLILDPEFVELFTTGKVSPPHYGLLKRVARFTILKIGSITTRRFNKMKECGGT